MREALNDDPSFPPFQVLGKKSLIEFRSLLLSLLWWFISVGVGFDETGIETKILIKFNFSVNTA